MTRSQISTWTRLAFFLAWSGMVISLWLVRRIFLVPRKRAMLAAGYSSLWSKGVLRLLDLKVTLQGKPPSPPFFLVANHLGYLDIAVIASQLPCTFVAKSEVADWPLFGTLASLAGTLFIDRESIRDTGRVNTRIKDHLNLGGSLVLFPEGTSTDGNAVAPFRSSLLSYPATTGMPVYCASIRYLAPKDGDPASQAMCWWGNMTLWPHLIRLFSMREMRAIIQFVPDPILDTERKQLAKKLQVTIATALEMLKGVPD